MKIIEEFTRELRSGAPKFGPMITWITAANICWYVNQLALNVLAGTTTMAFAPAAVALTIKLAFPLVLFHLVLNVSNLIIDALDHAKTLEGRNIVLNQIKR